MSDERLAYRLIGGYGFHVQLGVFVGTISKQDNVTGEIEVCTVGVEPTELLIMDWIRESIALMRTTGRTDVQMPDAHNRATMPMN